MPDSDLLTAYARSLGIRIHEHDAKADTTPILVVDPEQAIEGRPGHFHGGAISGLMETAGYAALRSALSERGPDLKLKPINITVQFLAAAKMDPLFAQARITKLGRRNANVAVECWQDDRSRPRATAVMNVLVADRG
ncbi:PaaI family thioesterase [Erythrobacter sp. LQ02-29]|uniref:PaaI family thioesterase n=1 Tax=Erythrobacter sp. LQ02-29 TaxID=2920384 RepID=UPI001F4EC27F|nr:PaaI family thioesterase [Erythrobacter sp. LQ02-29]